MDLGNRMCCNLRNRNFKANVARIPVQWLSIFSLRTKLRWIVGYFKVSRIYALQLHYPQKNAIWTRSLRRKFINIFIYLFATMKLVSQNQTSPKCPSLWLCLAMSQGWPTHWPKRHPKQHQKHSPKRRPRKQQRRPVGQRPGDRFQQTGNMLILSKSYCHILVKDFNMTSTPHCCVLFQSYPFVSLMPHLVTKWSGIQMLLVRIKDLRLTDPVCSETMRWVG